MDESDLTTFVNLVRSMRNAQKDYFRTHDYNTLLESKKLESLVDRFIKRFDESFQKERDSKVLGPELPF